MTKLGRPFLITSQGRTATKWLASVMNKSEQWRVRHEPPVMRFGVPYLGYVSPKHLMRPINPGFKYGVLFRAPARVASSVFHRCWANDRPDLLKLYVDSIHSYARRMDLLVGKHGAVPINFAMMVSSTKYAQKLFERFGVIDVDITANDLSSGVKNRPYRPLPDGEYPPIWRRLKLDTFNQTHKHLGPIYEKHSRESLKIDEEPNVSD